MPLTGKQKRELKQRGQTMADDCRLGKGLFSDEFAGHLSRLLDKKELVKMRFADLEGKDRKALARAVCEAVDAELVQVVGRTVLLYRAKPDEQGSGCGVQGVGGIGDAGIGDRGSGIGDRGSGIGDRPDFIFLK